MSKKILQTLTVMLLVSIGNTASHAMCSCNCYAGNNPPPAYTFYHWYNLDSSCSYDCMQMGYEFSCCDWGGTCPTSASERKGQTQHSKKGITRFDPSKDHKVNPKEPGVHSKTQKEPKVQPK